MEDQPSTPVLMFVAHRDVESRVGSATVIDVAANGMSFTEMNKVLRWARGRPI